MILTLPVSHLVTEENYEDVPGIEALEYKNPDQTTFSALPALLHLVEGVTQRGFSDLLKDCRPLLEATSVKVFSFDLGPAAEIVDIKDNYYVPVIDPLPAEDLLFMVKDRVQWAKEVCQGLVGLENLNYYPTPAYKTVCDPGFIREAIEEANAGLVLDLAHALVSAGNLGMHVNDYLKTLPLERTLEVHLSKPEVKNGKWHDSHKMPDDELLQVFYVLRKKLPDCFYCAIEYYGDFDKLCHCYGRLVKDTGIE